MRVLHIYSGNLYGGVETLLLTLARYYHLCPAMEPHFALCFEGRLSEELAAVGARIHLLGNVRVRWPLSVWPPDSYVSQEMDPRANGSQLLAQAPFEAESEVRFHSRAQVVIARQRQEQ